VLHQELYVICTSGRNGTRLSKTKWAREPCSHAAGHIRGYKLYNYHHNIMKLTNLRLDSANKPSPISEGVAEIRINSQQYKGIKLTTRDMQARRASRVATVHDAVKETIMAHLTLVHVLHAYVSTDTPWVTHALSHCTPIRYGRIASVSAAHDATQFGDSICLVCVSTFQMLVHSDLTDAGLN
jgi:hypothetical protein